MGVTRAKAFALLCLLASPVSARTTSLFQTFFPAWHGYLHELMESECRDERDNYHNPANGDLEASYKLTNCLLKAMDEFKKTEMGITAVILGLLPTMLQQVGPTITEVSVLATRRPLLTFLLGVGMPSVRTSGGVVDEPSTALRQQVDFRVLPRVSRPLWALISVTEYLLATAAAANSVYQVWQVANWSVSVPAIAIFSPVILSRTYPMFMWLALLVPIHIIGFLAFKLQYQVESGGLQRGNALLGILSREFVSCYKSAPLLLTRKKDRGPFSTLMNQVTEVGSVVVFIFGTVVLSSQIFISLGDVVPVIARFMMGTLVCRAILLFELHGLREVTSSSASSVESNGASGSRYELVQRVESGMYMGKQTVVV